jgi:hypothetical protein
LACLVTRLFPLALALIAQRADTVVRVASNPVHAGVASLMQELSIGTADGADEYVLGRITDVAVAPNGTIYVLDKSVPIVRAYDASGRFIRNFGRRGQGPGEYTSVAGLKVLPDGRLIVWDLGSWRINVYAANGDVLDHWPTGGSGSADVDGPNFVTVDTAGTIYLRKNIYATRPVDRVIEGRTVTAQVPDYTTRRDIWIRRRPGSPVLDTLEAPPAPDFPSRAMRVETGPGSSMTMAIPYDPHYVLALSPMGYFVSGFSNRYAFEINYPDGRIVSIRRNVPQEPVTAAERSNARAVVTARVRMAKPSWSWDGPDVPRTKPSFGPLMVALDGRIWVNVTPARYVMPVPSAPPPSGGIGGGRGGSRGRGPIASCAEGVPTRHDVFEPDGRYLGRVEFPPALDVRAIRGDVLWAKTCDADDTPVVRRYRINWSR